MWVAFGLHLHSAGVDQKTRMHVIHDIPAEKLFVVLTQLQQMICLGARQREAAIDLARAQKVSCYGKSRMNRR